MNKHSRPISRLLFAALAAVVAGAGFERPPVSAAPQTPVTAATLQDLRGLDELKSMFNRDAGNVRLVLLLSPT